MLEASSADRPVRARLTSIVDRPIAIRWLGFAGAVLLGAAAWVGGAFPTLRPNANPLTIAAGPNGPLIYILWISGTAGLCAAWWYGLRHVGRGEVTARWVATTAALWMFPMVIAPPTGSRDIYSYACQGDLVAAGHNPYVDGVSALPCQWLDSVSPIWRDTPTPYGPLFLMIAGPAARLGSLTAAIVVFRVLAVASVVLIGWAVAVLARRLDAPVDRALWLSLACPLVVVHLVGGAHNDALTVGLLVAGFAVLAGRSKRWWTFVAGGVLLGLAISVKSAVGVTIPFAALLACGGPPLPRPSVVAARVAGVFTAALGTLFGLSFASGFGVGWLSAVSATGTSVVWTSPSTAVGLAIGYLGRPFGVLLHPEPVTRLIALILLPIGLALILLRFWNRDQMLGAAFALLAVIFFGPIDQPWYLIWPLAMLAVTRARVRWFLIAVLVVSCIEMPDGSGLTKIIQLPAAFLMTGVMVWVLGHAYRWARGTGVRTIEPRVTGPA